MSSVSHERSASLLAPRRPTARCPWTCTLHTSLATPPESRSMRATSSPHCPSASHPTVDIFDQPDWWHHIPDGWWTEVATLSPTLLFGCAARLLAQDELEWRHSS